MKIIQIIPHLGSGGAERFVVDLCNELSERGHEVILCTLLTLDNVIGFYVPQLSSKVRLVSLNKKLGFSFKAMWDFTKFVKKEQPDIIHSHLNTPPYVLLAELFLCRGFHTIHNDAQKEASDIINQWVRRFLFRLKRSIPVTISDESHASFVKYYGFKTPIIYNGRNIPYNLEISPEVKEEFKTFRKTPQTRCLVQLARFEPAKNIPMMARVASRLANEGFDFSIINVGIPSNKEIYEEVLKVKPSCQYIVGQKENPLEYLKEAGAYALSSSWEGLPISLIEALGVGAIPVVTPAGGVVNLVKDKGNGFISKDTSEEEYYKTFKRYLQASDEELEDMKAEALKSYAPFTMTECAEKYLKCYKKLLQ